MNYNKDMSPMPYTIGDIQDLQAQGLFVLNELDIFVKSIFFEMNVDKYAFEEVQNKVEAMFEAFDQMYNLLFWNLPEEVLVRICSRVIN